MKIQYTLAQCVRTSGRPVGRSGQAKLFVKNWKILPEIRLLSKEIKRNFLRCFQILRIFRWNVVLSEASFEELQELFEVVVNFKDPEKLDKLADLNDLSSKLSADQVAEALLQVMPNCTDFIKECHWQGSKEDCSSIFELRKTDDGFCCSFNALRQSEIVDLSAIRSPSRRVSDDDDDEVRGSAFTKYVKTKVRVLVLVLPQ